MCEVSAAAPLDADHFAVASDETNVLKIYRRGRAEPVGELDAVEDATGFDKSDIEGSARIGSRIYWISSHSYNKDGKDRPKRKLFFATEIKAGANGPALELAGKARTDLRDAIAGAAGAPAASLNIEGLAATEDGALLIGLRAPLTATKRAIVVRLENPGEVVTTGAAPRFGETAQVDLGGRGIRSIERVGTGERPFVIVAGPLGDGAAEFELRAWSGRPKDETTMPLDGGVFAGSFFPEALVALSGSELLAMSDEGDFVRPDGTKCDDEKPATKPAFRVRSVPPPK